MDPLEYSSLGQIVQIAPDQGQKYFQRGGLSNLTSYDLARRAVDGNPSSFQRTSGPPPVTPRYT